MQSLNKFIKFDKLKILTNLRFVFFFPLPICRRIVTLTSLFQSLTIALRPVFVFRHCANVLSYYVPCLP